MMSLNWCLSLATMGTLLLLATAIARGAEPLVESGAQPMMKFTAVDELPQRAALPEALTMLDGSPVRTRDDWHMKRRPQLKALFGQYVYGQTPPSPGIASVFTQEAVVLGGKAKLKEIEIKLKGLPEDAPRIHLALFVPIGAGRAEKSRAENIRAKNPRAEPGAMGVRTTRGRWLTRVFPSGFRPVMCRSRGSSPRSSDRRRRPAHASEA